MAKKKTSLFDMLRLAKPFWGQMVLIASLILLISLVRQLDPQLNRAIIDHITTKQPVNFFGLSLTLPALMALWLIATFIGTLINRLSVYVSARLRPRLQFHLRDLAFNNLLDLSISYYHHTQSGQVMSKIARGTQEGSRLITNLGSHFLPTLITGVISIVFVASIRWEIALAAVVGFVPYFFFRFRRQEIMQKIDKKLHKIWDEEYSHFYETISSIRLVKSFAAEPYERSLFARIARKIIRYSDQEERIENRFIFANLLLEFWTWAIYAYSAYLGLNGVLSVGTVVLMIQYVSMIKQPLWNLDWVYWQIKSAQIAAQDYLDIVYADEYLPQPEEPLILDSVRGHLLFSHISFTYPEKNGQHVFSDFDLEVQPGQTLAVVGRSGAGKTTLAHLLVRFFDPNRGVIQLDGHDIKDLDVTFLRQNIGLVMQQSYLFDDTIEENLRYAKPTATLKEMKLACQIANADEFINKLPKKYRTRIGDRGIKLSGGQQQRLSIARTILKNPPILVLDEATSSLDSHSERLVQDALWKLIKGRTTIIIAHRLSTIQKADQIIVLGKKTIQEQGTHEELIAKKSGIYASLHRIQSGQIERLKAYDLVS